ncbi:MAG: universal stress protein [Chloroflexota bacterium]
MRILIAYDGDEPGRRALDAGALLGAALGASLDVISVVPTASGRSPITPWDDRSAHAEELREAQDYLRGRGFEPTLIEETGEPATTIERIGTKAGYDMIVVGPRGIEAVNRILQGSISAHVAAHAETTVLVAR